MQVQQEINLGAGDPLFNGGDWLKMEVRIQQSAIEAAIRANLTTEEMEEQLIDQLVTGFSSVVESTLLEMQANDRRKYRERLGLA